MVAREKINQLNALLSDLLQKDFPKGFNFKIDVSSVHRLNYLKEDLTFFPIFLKDAINLSTKNTTVNEVYGELLDEFYELTHDTARMNTLNEEVKTFLNFIKRMPLENE